MGKIKQGDLVIEELKNSGLEVAPTSPENYCAGEPEFLGVASPLTPPPIIFPNGIGWKQVSFDYGSPEMQKNPNFDTYSCVIFSIAKALCLHTFKCYGIKYTVSEMFNAVMAGVIPNRGTTIEKGMESFRKYGWVEDKDYPFTAQTTLAQFFKYPPKSIILKAGTKLIEWDFNWEVLPRDLASIIEVYKRTPVVVTVSAWASYYGTGVYFDYNQAVNHATLAIEPLTNGNNLIYDSYPKDFVYVENSKIDVKTEFKELDKSFKYGSAHRCWLTPKKKQDSFINLKNMLSNIWGWFETVGSPKGLRVYFVPTDSDGKPRGKQEINFNEPILVLKILFSALMSAKAFKKTDWGEISKLEDKTFI